MKNLKNRKGFTLIELLAVIIILAILMTLAITAMTGYIRNARKDTFITTAQQYANAARLSFVNNEYENMPESGQCLVIQTNTIALESGSKDSSFGEAFVDAQSFVVIRNASDAGASDKYEYYIQMVDQDGNGFELKGENDVVRDDVKESGLSPVTVQTSGSSSTIAVPGHTGCVVSDVIDS